MNSFHSNILVSTAVILSLTFLFQTYIDYQRLQIEQKRENAFSPFYEIVPTIFSAYNKEITAFDDLLTSGENDLEDNDAIKPTPERKQNPRRPGTPVSAEEFLEAK